MWPFILSLHLMWVLTGAQEASLEVQKLIEDYNRQLQGLTVEVLTQYSDQPSEMGYLAGEPPLFQMPAGFMHSFRPNSGVGNREDLIIDGIRQVTLFDDASFSKWQYMRFNNSDYLLGIAAVGVVLWQKNLNPSQPLDFAVDDGIFRFHTENQGTISDAVMFTHRAYKNDVFYVAILSENTRSSFISIYEIIDGKGMMITVIDLGMYPMDSSYLGRRLAYVHSRHGGLLGVLFPNAAQANIVYRRKGSNALNHYIEVHYPSAVSMVSFKVGEHGYIAVANKTACDVYKMGDFAQNHLLFERLHFEGEINGLENFRLGFHRYLSVSLADRQFLYIWKPGGFFKAQEFYISGVRQVFGALLPNCRDDVILAFLKDDASHEFYVWSGQLERFVPTSVGVPANMLPLPGTVASFSYGSSVYLLFVDQYGKTEIFAIDTHLSPVKDPIVLIGKEVSDLMKQLQAAIASQREKINVMSALLAYAVRPYGDQHFSSLQAINNMDVTGEVHAATIIDPSTISWEGSTLTLAEYYQGTDDLEARLYALEQGLNELDALLPDIVRTDQDTIITGRKTFTGDVYAPSIFAQSVNIDSIGGIDLKELQKQLYRLDKPVTIMGTLKFEKPLSIVGDLDVESTINGIDLSKDVLTTNSEQVSHAKMTFHNTVIVNGNLDIQGKLNGIDIGTEVVTLNGNHYITGKKFFKSGIVANDIYASYIDGVDIEGFYRRAMTRSGNQTVTAKKHFSRMLQTQDVFLSGKINSYDINELAADIVRIDVPSTMSTKTFLQDVHIEKELAVRGTINGLRIPDDIFLRNQSNQVSGRKDFHGTLYVDDIRVMGTVDGLNLPSDIITLSADEAIENTLYFTDGIVVDKDITVHGLVDGVDISELAKDVLKAEESLHIDTVECTGPITILGDLNVHGTINGIPLNDILGDIVYRDDRNVVIKAQKHFSKLTAKSVEVKKLINGYNIKKDFVTVSGDQVIYDEKVFHKPVTFRSITTANDVIGKVNLTQLYMNRITLSIEEQLTGDLDFVDHLIVDGDLIVHGSFDGYKFPEDFVLTSTDQVVSNKVFQGTTYVKNMFVDGNINTGLFGGLELPKFLDERVTLSTDQVIEGDLYLGNVIALTVNVSGLVNNIDIVDFANNVMSLTRDQTVTAFKEFSGLTTIWGSLTTHNGINGIAVDEVDKRAVKLHGENHISSPVVFVDGVTFENLTTTGLINGINLTKVDEDSVKTEGVHFVMGKTTFHKGFHVNGDIIAASVNGLNLPEDVLTKNTPQIIKGTYTFSNLVINGNVDIAGLVNGIDLSEVAPKLARTDRHNVIHSDLVFKFPVSVSGDLFVEGLVNGLDLKVLNKTAITKSGEQHVTGHKVLRGNVTVYGDMNVAYLNGINWTSFLEDVVRIDAPQTIVGAKIWDADLEVTGDVFVKGFAEIYDINGVGLLEFIEEAVFVNQPAIITGTKIFSSPIEIAGNMNAELINNLNLKTDVITVNCGDKDPQIISGQKYFQNLTVYGDVIVKGLVNGYKLQDLAANTLMTYGDQVITGHKTFYRPATFLKNLYPTTLNGLNVSNDLVTLDKPQGIMGSMAFLGDVHVNSNLQITGLLNGIDLLALSKEILYVDTQDLIEGEFTIDHVISKYPVVVKGLVNGMNLEEFSRDVEKFWREKHADLASLASITKDHCELAQRLHSSLETSYYVLDGFAVHQVLNVSGDYIEFEDGLPYITLTQQYDSLSAYRMQYQWLPADQMFHYVSRDKTAGLRHKRLSFAGHEIHIQIGLKARGSLVEIDGVHVPSIRKGFSEADVSSYQNVLFIVLLYSKNKTCETYVMTDTDVQNSVAQLINSIYVEGASSLAIFNLNDVMHLAISHDNVADDYEDSSKLYLWANDQWQVSQKIKTSASSQVTHFVFHNYHYLAFTSSTLIYQSKGMQEIHIYRNSDSSNRFSLFQRISFGNVEELSVFEFGGLPDLYLIAYSQTRLQVFLYKGETGFQTTFSLNSKCVSAVRAFVLYRDLYLVVSQQSELRDLQLTTIYKGIVRGSAVSPRNLTCS